MPPHICMIHDDFADTGAIGRSAKWQAQIAVEAGWRVTLVSANVDSDLASHVEVRPLTIPLAIHLIQWLAARTTVRRAMGTDAYDLVVTHQPQVASIADLWHVRFLSRANIDAGGLPAAGSAKDRIRRLQFEGVAFAEDRFLRRLAPSTEVVFHSQSLLDVYSRYYGTPPHHAIVPNPGPDPRGSADASRRRECRDYFGLPEDAFVIGFLGGTDRRKGGDRLVDAVAGASDLHVLFAGAGGEDGFGDGPDRRVKRAGFLDRQRTWDFYDAIDVLAVPSRFEPWGVVVNEAAATGTPSIVTPQVGAASELLAHRAGLTWEPGVDDLQQVVTTLRADMAGYRRRALAMANELSFSRMAPAFLSLYERAIERKSDS